MQFRQPNINSGDSPPIYQYWAGAVKRQYIGNFSKDAYRHTHIVYNTHTHTHHWRIILKKKKKNYYIPAKSDGSTRQKQRALVLVFLSNFPVIHLPLNNKMIDSLSLSDSLFLSISFCSCVFFNRLLLCPYDPGYATRVKPRLKRPAGKEKNVRTSSILGILLLCTLTS